MTDNGNFLRGQGPQARLESFDLRLLQQLRRQHALVPNVQVLLAPIPNLSSGDLPLRGARSDRRFTRLAFELATDCEQVSIRSRQVELAHIDRQAESDIKSKLLLQSIAVAFNFQHGLIKTGDGPNLQVAGFSVLPEVAREDIDRSVLGNLQS